MRPLTGSWGRVWSLKRGEGGRCQVASLSAGQRDRGLYPWRDGTRSTLGDVRPAAPRGLRRTAGTSARGGTRRTSAGHVGHLRNGHVAHCTAVQDVEGAGGGREPGSWYVSVSSQPVKVSVSSA